MAKITVCTDDGEVFDIIEDIKLLNVEKSLSWASICSDVKDALLRAINAESTEPDIIVKSGNIRR